jgi:hypothetical protein
MAADNVSSFNDSSNVLPTNDSITNLSTVTELATKIAYIIIGSVGLLGNSMVITVIVSNSTMLKQVRPSENRIHYLEIDYRRFLFTAHLKLTYYSTHLVLPTEQYVTAKSSGKSCT